jgi:hypothetical protein
MIDHSGFRASALASSALGLCALISGTIAQPLVDRAKTLPGAKQQEGVGASDVEEEMRLEFTAPVQGDTVRAGPQNVIPETGPKPSTETPASIPATAQVPFPQVKPEEVCVPMRTALTRPARPAFRPKISKPAPTNAGELRRLQTARPYPAAPMMIFAPRHTGGWLMDFRGFFEGYPDVTRMPPVVIASPVRAFSQIGTTRKDVKLAVGPVTKPARLAVAAGAKVKRPEKDCPPTPAEASSKSHQVRRN